jgi:hypothetical protein
MKSGYWSDRIAAAKQRGFRKRMKKVVGLQPKPSAQLSRRSIAEEWNRQWRKRIADARARGRERAQVYRGMRIYEAAIIDQKGKFHAIYLEGLNNDTHAKAHILAVYEPKEIVNLLCTGYKIPEPERSKNMPDGRPKLKLDIE